MVIAEFIEIEIGTNKRARPQMAKALAACRLRHAVLVIAKLDRLARNVHLISGLMESAVEFVAATTRMRPASSFTSWPPLPSTRPS